MVSSFPFREVLEQFFKARLVVLNWKLLLVCNTLYLSFKIWMIALLGRVFLVLVLFCFVFSFHHFEYIVPLSFYHARFSLKSQLIVLWEFPLYLTSCFSLAAFEILLSFFKFLLSIMYLGVDLLDSSCMEFSVLPAPESLFFFPKLGRFQPLFLQINHLCSLYFSSPFGPLLIQMSICWCYHRGLSICVIFSKKFFLFFY